MKTNREEGLYIWCLEQTLEKYHGTLSKEKIDALDSLDFPWNSYEEDLIKQGLIPIGDK